MLFRHAALVLEQALGESMVFSFDSLILFTTNSDVKGARAEAGGCRSLRFLLLINCGAVDR